MIYRPPRALGFGIGVLVAFWAGALFVALLVRGATLDVSFAAFLAYVGASFFLALAALFVYWAYACLSVAYVVDRNGLAIQWGATRQLIPLDQIQRLVPGRNLPPPKVRGVSWPGHHVGRGQVAELGETLFYSTHLGRRDLVYVVTPTLTYGISVHDPALFARELQTRRDLGAIRPVEQRPVRGLLAVQAFWMDRRVQLLLALAVAMCALVAGYLFAVYPTLDDTIQLSFPSLGGVKPVGAKSTLLQIPNTALGVLLINAVLALALHIWERMVSYMILLGGIFTQFVFLVAVFIAVN